MTEKFLAEVMLMSFNSIGGVQPEAHKITRSYGGVHPADKKSPANAAAISTIALPPQVVIPMSQHIGAPCTPLVAVGDEVKLGQKIGDSPKPVSAPIHASVSGKVIAIEPRLNSMGNMDAWYRQYLVGKNKGWGDGLIAQMLQSLDFPIEPDMDLLAAKNAVRDAYPAEFAFLRSLPHIIETDDTIFVHGGYVPERGAFACMGLDAQVHSTIRKSQHRAL